MDYEGVDAAVALCDRFHRCNIYRVLRPDAKPSAVARHKRLYRYSDIRVSVISRDCCVHLSRVYVMGTLRVRCSYCDRPLQYDHAIPSAGGPQTLYVKRCVRCFKEEYEYGEKTGYQNARVELEWRKGCLKAGNLEALRLHNVKIPRNTRKRG